MAVQDVLSTKHVKERRKSKKKIWSIRLFILPLHSLKGNTDKSLRHGIFLRDLGTLADRLGNGLQNRVEQFDSARYLKAKGLISEMISILSCFRNAVFRLCRLHHYDVRGKSGRQRTLHFRK